MLALPIDPVEVGSVYRKLPAHVTILSWFLLDQREWSGLDQAIREEVLVESSPGNNVFGVHALAGAIVRQHGAQYDPTYMGINWHPHVSDTTDTAIKVGEQVTLRQLAMFDKNEASVKTVRATYEW